MKLWQRLLVIPFAPLLAGYAAGTGCLGCDHLSHPPGLRAG